MISLTIKEGGKLDKLRKQLKSLVGDKGEKKLQLPTLDLGVERDIRFIKNNITRLLPLTTPDTNYALSLMAESMIRDMKDRTKEWAKGMIPTKSSEQRQLMIDLGLPKTATILELTTRLEKDVEEFIAEAEEIQRGVWTGSKAQIFLNRLKSLQSSLSTEGGKQLTFYRDIQNALSERNKELVSMFRKEGFKLMGEFNIWEIQREWFEKNREGLTLSFDDFKKYIEKKLEKGDIDEISKHFDEIYPFFRDEGNSLLNAINKSVDKLGITLPERLTEASLFKNEKLLATLLGAYTHAVIGEKGVLFPGYKEIISGFMKEYGKGKGFNLELEKGMYLRRPKHIDTMFFQATEKALKKIGISDSVAKALASEAISPLEQKNILKKLNIPQLEDYEKLLGVPIPVIAAQVQDGVEELMKGPVLTMQLLSKMKELGQRTSISAEESQKLQEVAQEKVKKEVYEESLKKILKSVDNNEDSVKTMINMLRKALTEKRKKEPEVVPGGDAFGR